MAEIMVAAGEVSGDMQAAAVVREIKKLAPKTKFWGMGSFHLKNEGVNVLIDPTEISTIGFMEAFKNINTHLENLRFLSNKLEQNQPDVIFLVDNSGFNMLLTRIAFKKNIPVVNYFPPGAWIWGKWRAKWMARYNAMIAAVFPMERQVYSQVGARVRFVGHPLLDMIKVKTKIDTIYQQLELNPESPIITLMPGSRSGEIKKLLTPMLAAAEKINQKYKNCQFIIPMAPGVKKSQINKKVSKYNLIVKLVNNYTYEILKITDLLLVASGTATLEAAILETPMIIVYKTSWSSFQLAKKLVKLDYIGMPNIIANNQIVPELLQKQVNRDEIYQEAIKLMDNYYLLKEMKRNLGRVKELLGEKGAVLRTAELVLQEGAIKYCVK